MNSQEVKSILRKIDNGYNPSEQETEELLAVEKMVYLPDQKLPQSIYLLKKLRQLDLNYNMPTFFGLFFTESLCLPNTLGSLGCLEILNISGIGITELPESIQNLTNLRTLNLSGTRLNNIPDWICRLSKLRKLNLSNTKITKLPDTIGEMTELRSLDLSNSNITELPVTIGKLTKLIYLNLSRSFISELPETIGNLSYLRYLDLCDSNIKKLPEAIETLGNLSYLNMRSTKVSELPEVIWKLNSLQKLVLSNTQIVSLTNTIGNLSNLRTLDISYTQIKELPESIGILSKLCKIKLRDTKIRAIPETIGNLSNLQLLDLKDTCLAQLPESIGNLSSLRTFDLSDTCLTQLPESIGNLSSLRTFDLCRTNITKLPKTIGNISLLQVLLLSNTQLEALPDTIGCLSNLQELLLSNSQLEEVPETIGNISKLHQLRLDNTRIKTLPITIGNLDNLMILELSNTKIEVLPDSFVNLSNLQELNLSNTKLYRLPTWLGKLPNIKCIGIDNDSLVDLPQTLLDLKPIFIKRPYGGVLPYNNTSAINSKNINTIIYIDNLRLTKQPVSLFLQPKDLIIKYFESDKITLKEAKVVFMGDGGAGKSYTIQRIIHDGKPLEQDTVITHNISIDRWENSNYIVNFDGTIDFWDFGGQDIYLSMHRCFLTERSCYVIVLCNRQYGSHRGLMRQARYWLKTLFAFLQDSPILFAVNTWNGQPRDGLSLTELKKEYPTLNIVDQIVYDAHDTNINEFNRLTNRICKMVQDHYSYSLQFPISWNNIRKRLVDEYRSENYILDSLYYQICEEEMTSCDGYYDEEMAHWLLNWFNDLGYCLHYKKNRDSLLGKGYQILKPQWVIRAMYKIINFKVSFSIEDSTPDVKNLPNILSRNAFYAERMPTEVVFKVLTTKHGFGEYYSKAEAEYLIQLLINFKLAYRIIDQDTDELFIPSLCSDIRPNDFDNVDEKYELKMEYLIRYQNLPESVIQLLMIKCYNNDKALHQIWKHGFRFQIKNGIIIVEMLNETEIVIRYYYSGDTNDIYGLHEVRTWLFEICKEHRVNDGRDFIVKKTPHQTAIISVKALTDAYRKNPKIELFYVQDDDIYQGYSVPNLLSGIYGSNYKYYLLKEENEISTTQNTPEKLSKEYLTVNLLEKIILLLNELLLQKKESDYTKVIQNTAKDIINTMREIHLDDISENVRNQDLLKDILQAGEKGDNEKLIKLLSDGNSIAEGLKNIVGFAKFATLI